MSAGRGDRAATDNQGVGACLATTIPQSRNSSMKHILLGTSALVAAGLLAAPANAAEKIKLGLGGFYAASMGAILDDDNDAGESGDNRDSFAIHQNVEVHFKGETTLDNGITVGARVELEG